MGTRRILCSAIVVAVAAVGCERGAAPPIQPVPEVRRVAPTDSSWPKEAQPAFLPGSVACDAPYERLDGACVHAAFVARTPREQLKREIALYKRGASAPTVGGPPAPLPYPEERPRKVDPSQLPPDALSKRAPERDAEKIREGRVEALNQMIARVQEQIEAGRPKRVLPSVPLPQPQAPISTVGTAPPASARPRVPGTAERWANDDNLAGGPDQDVTPSDRPPARDDTLGGSPSLASALDPATRARLEQLQVLAQQLSPEEALHLMQQLESSGLHAMVNDQTWAELTQGIEAQAQGVNSP